MVYIKQAQDMRHQFGCQRCHASSGMVFVKILANTMPGEAWHQVVLRHDIIIVSYAGSCLPWAFYDDVIKWKHFPRYWPFVRGIHRSTVNSPHKGQWRGALLFSLICAWINGWVNSRDAGDLIRYRDHYDVTVMWNFQQIVSLCKLVAFIGIE